MNVLLFAEGRLLSLDERTKSFLSMIGCTEDSESYRIDVMKGEALEVSFEAGQGVIKAPTKAAFFRGLGLLKENAEKTSSFSIKEAATFDSLGASFDMSRNGVVKLSTLKKLVMKMALMGFNSLFLYTEDTYPVSDEPFFGYLRGAYTKDELKELDELCSLFGIELIPCIQTLGHLERFLHWPDATKYKDTKEVLMVGEEKVYDLIDRMFSSCRECYRTHKIHVGMDEAMDLGLGKYLMKNGYENGFSIMQKHIERVLAIAYKYEFEPMMWSDMYFRCASPTHDYYEDDINIPAEVVANAPISMALVYWDYYHNNKEFYDRYINEHKKFAAPLWFAGGMWTWMGPAIDYDVFFSTSLPALESCKKNGIKNVMVTTWGDDGAEVNIATMLLGLQVYAEWCWNGSYERERVNERFRACCGEEAERFERIAQFNKTAKMDVKSNLPNADKFLLWQDPLLGLHDIDIEGLGFKAQYEDLETEFRSYAEEGGAFSLQWEFYAALAHTLSLKSELGLDILRAYQEKNMAELKKLSIQARSASESIRTLRDAWWRMWRSTNKPNGFEVIEVRLGGVAFRLLSAAERLEELISGKVDIIEELEEERVHILRKPGTDILNGSYCWREIVTAAKAF